MRTSYYPKSPEIDKQSLTKVTGQYRTQIIINLIAIVLFFVLFIAMIVGSVYLIDFTIFYPLRENFTKWDILLKIGVVAMSIMLFLFLLKFLVKKHSTENPLNVEIKKEEHPGLFDFIKTLSDEVGAPFPKRVFVSHEINASVFYNSTVLSLFFPVKKNLLIGLGLVNSVNLSEFKAVLAHEFGHFAQSSMKVGSYVYMANRIIYDMVNERDQWDDLLDRWKNADIRFSIFAWLLSPIIWLVRLFMGLLYRGLNMLHSSLSRQMEYNADLVAVSVTGSNSIINALYKIGLTGQSFNMTLGQLQEASDQNIYTEDIFYNHRKCHDFLNHSNKDFQELALERKISDPSSQYQLYDQDDGEVSAMYASHPSNYKREQNAKKTYVDGIIDERSSWEIFNQPDQLAQKVSMNLYRVTQDKKDLNFTDKMEVQSFIENEINETIYGERYHGFFDARRLHTPERSEFAQLVNKYEVTSDNLAQLISELWDDTFRTRMNEVKLKQEKLNEIIQLAQAENKSSTVEVKGKIYTYDEFQSAFNAISEWMQEDDKWFVEMGERFYTHYAKLSKKLTPEDEKFDTRYTLMASINVIFERLDSISPSLESEIQKLAEKNSLTELEIKEYSRTLFDIKLKFEDLIREANSVDMPPLDNIGEIKKLGIFLLKESVAFLPVNSVDFERIQVLRDQIQNVDHRLWRIYSKNLSVMLKELEDQEAQLSTLSS